MDYPPKEIVEIFSGCIEILKKMDKSRIEKISNEYKEISNKIKPSEVSDIIGEYAVVLETCRLVAPVSTLPYSKEKIKQAIKLRLLCEYVTMLQEWKITKLEFMGKETALDDFLQVGYMLLARFIDDEQARFVIKHFDIKKLEEMEKKKDGEKLFFESFEKVPNILEQVVQEMDILIYEFALVKAVGMLEAICVLKNR